MAFTVRDFQDLIQLLSEHPDWREELRRTLLSDEFLALPAIVRELAEAQKRSEERLTRLEQVVAELAETQRQSEKRLAGVEERLSRLEAIIQRLAEQVSALAQAQGRTEDRLGRIISRSRKYNGLAKT